jgi:ATP-dependent protease ClpP protease subunit
MRKIPQFKIEIRNQTEDEATIDIEGEIGGIDWDTWESINTPKQIKAQLKKIAALETKKIVVNINSLGGYIDDGLAIHDILASHEAEIETNVTGLTASAATIIAQAGDVRKISDNALYLVHKGWGMMLGNANDAQAYLDDLNKMDGRIANIYAKRSNKTVDEFLELMNANNGDGKWLDPQEAIEFGLVDEVYEPMKVAASVDFGLFKNFGLPVPEITADIGDYEGDPVKVSHDQSVCSEAALKLVDKINEKLAEKWANPTKEEKPKRDKKAARKRKLNLIKNKAKWM